VYSNIIEIAFTNFVIKAVLQYVYPIPKHWSRSHDFPLYYNLHNAVHTRLQLYMKFTINAGLIVVLVKISICRSVFTTVAKDLDVCVFRVVQEMWVDEGSKPPP